MSKSNSHINRGFKFEATELTRVDELVRSRIELKTFSDNFLNEFANCIEEDDRPEGFGGVVHFFVGFRDDDHSGSLEMQRPISYFNTCISNVDDKIETIIIFENNLQVAPRHLFPFLYVE